MSSFLPLVMLVCALSIVVAQDVSKRKFFFCSPKVIVSNVRRCPCFMSARFIRSSGLSLSVFIVSKAEFDSWEQSFKTAQQVGGSMPPISNGPGKWVPLPLIPVTKAGEQQLSTRASRFDEIGSFVLVTIARFGCTTGQIVLENRPEVCPLRLAKRESVTARNGVSTFVVGGTKVSSDDEFNGYNALISTIKGNCTGTVISKEWILTAAHCRVSPGAIARIGGTSLSNGKPYFVDSSIRHEGYVGQASFAATRIVNDIAVLKLSQAIENPQIIKLNSNNRGPDPGTIVRATGYGLVATAFPSSSLRMVDIAVLSTGECRRRFRSTGKFRVARGVERRYHLCSGRDNGCSEGGVCFGDSGGPIFARISDGSLVQVGITSFGDTTCADSNSADVFARVSTYVPWIQRVTGGAATTAEWKSINNVAASGSFGTENEENDLPLWAVVSIAIGAGVAVVAIGLICFLFIGKRRNRGNEEEGTDSVSASQYRAVLSPNTIQSPPAAFLTQSTQPSAPPSPLIPYPDNSPSAPPLPGNSRRTLGNRPVQ